MIRVVNGGQETISTHNIASKGPRRPTTNPPILKSEIFKNPVLYTMALGGVETGRNRAVEDARPMMIAIFVSNPTRIAIPRGIRTVLVAV